MHKNHDLNYKIAKFFLDNSRITLLSLVVLVILGVASTLSLKTTGFPSPDVGIVLVNTVYPGASSDTVLKDVTKPVESIIKGLEGIDTYASNSTNSVSIVSATLKPGFKTDAIQTKINSGLSSIKLPSSVTTTISTPAVGGVDFIFTMYDKDNAKLYKGYQEVKNIIEKNSSTKNIKSDNELEEKVAVKLDRPTLAARGIDIANIQQGIKSLGESFPVVSNLNIENQKTSIVTKFNGTQDIEALKNLDIKDRTGLVKLKDISELALNYSFKKDALLIVGEKNGDKNYIDQALGFTVSVNANTDTVKYITDIEKEIEKLDTVSLGKTAENRVTLIKSYSVATENKAQVDEVLSGLVGGPLKVSDPNFAKIGWLLGGIQLVFLVMVAFVSWRAAIIAAVSIPLSLIFTNIYLFFTGQSLNTLVLFSFVLVIGLVVDPALVILESIQRKIDAGLKGKSAALAAITDVGGGLFMATITNIIVFAPFGLISGILGQIFQFIPLTIVPATIGSYVVPLVFLSWVSGRFLKKSKNAKANIAYDADPDLVEKELHKNEFENLWPIAKWLVSFNRKILNSHWALRLAIIFFTFAIAVLISSIYLGNGYIKNVQFSEPSNPQSLTLNIVHKNGTSDTDRNKLNKEIITEIMDYEEVHAVSPYLTLLRIELKEAGERKGNSVDLAKAINDRVNKTFKDKVFDVNIKPIANGPAGTAYQVQLSIAEENADKLKTAAIGVSKIFEKLCENDKKEVKIVDNCSGKKIGILRTDDGYTGKENTVEYIEFDRAKLVEKNLILPSANTPSLIYSTSNIKNAFAIDDGNKVNTILFEGRDVPVILDNKAEDPSSLDSISNLNLFSLSGQPIPLRDVANIVKKSPPASITRSKGETLGTVRVGLEEGKNDQAYAAKVTNAVVDYYKDTAKTEALGIAKDSVKSFSEGGAASFAKSFSELILALLFAIVATYFVLAIFFNSLSQPIAILYTVPLTFVGVFPALKHLGSGQFGFLEIIGLIILVGIVENVAIFLIDAANQLIKNDGMDDKEAVATASGLRFRPVMLTKLTAIASLAPLAWLSETYRPISLVIIFGLLASGFVSLITTPILFIAFRRASQFIRTHNPLNLFSFLPKIFSKVINFYK
jgi:hydrophobic/amphiphilic exporter-1 (mainly G- bacteria), HAE1 family